MRLGGAARVMLAEILGAKCEGVDGKKELDTEANKNSHVAPYEHIV